MTDIVLGIRLTADGKQLAGEVRVSREEFSKLREELGKNTSEAAKLNNEQKSLAQGMNVSANSIGAYSAAWSKATDIIVQAIGAVKDYIKEAALLNARNETLGIVMGVVGRNAGYSRGEMELYAESVRKAGITMLESRESVTRLVQANIDLSLASKLARTAQDAAVIAGINSSEAFGRLVYGIQSAQTEMLRTMGINVNFEDSYKKIAKQLKITTDQLTEQEKTQARANVVLEAGARIYGAYEAAMGTAGKQITSLARYEEDLKVLRGEVFNEALVIAVNAYTDSLKDANQEARQLSDNGKLRQWGRDIINIFAWVADIVRGAWDVIATGVEQTAKIVLRSLQGIHTAAIGMGLASPLSGREFGSFVDSFAGQANANMAARLNRPQMRDEAAKFFAQQDAEAAQKALEGRYDEWGYFPPGSGGTGTRSPGANKNRADPFQTLLESLRKKLQLDRESTAVEQLNAELQEKKYAKLTPLQQLELKLLAQAIDLKAQDAVKAKAAIEYAEQYARAEDGRQKVLSEFDTTFESHLEDIKNETELMGKSEAAREKQIELMKLQKQWLDVLNKTDPYDVDAVTRINDAYDRQRQQLSDALDSRAAAKKIADTLKETRQEAKKMDEDLQRGLTDSIFRGFEAGKDIAQNFRDSLVNMFKATILRPVIQWIVSPVTGAITAALGSLGIPGLANAAGGGGGGLGGLGSLSGLLNVNSLPGMGNPFGGAGGMLGSLSGAANGIFQDLGVSMGSQFLADIGNFGFGVPILGGLIGMATGGVKSGIGSMLGGVLGNMLLPGVGGVLGSAAGGLLGGMFGGGGGGPASFTGIDVNATLSRQGFAGQLFGTSKNSETSFRWPTFIPGNLQETANAAVASAFNQMTALAQQIGLDPSRLASVSANVSFHSASHDAAVITQDLVNNMGALTDQMAQALLPSIRDFAQAGETATQTLIRLAQVQEQLRQAEAQQSDQLKSAIRGLPGQLGITSLQQFQASLAVSDTLAPLTRLNAAHGALSDTYARAIGGDLGAVNAFPGAAQQLLGIGRDVYASGPEFQKLFVEVNRDLQSVLGRQQDMQADLLRNIDVSIVQSAQDQTAELVRIRKSIDDMNAQLQATQAELRRIAA